MTSSQIEKFENLKVSTQTILVYTNIVFNFDTIFKNFEVTPIDFTPLTKKKKNIDKKMITAPENSIISIQKGRYFRGKYLRKKKKYVCPIHNKKTIIEIVNEAESTQETSNIEYFCTECGVYYQPEKFKKICIFLNQITLDIYKENLLNIMMFKSCMKIAGCRSEQDAVDVVKLLWTKYLQPGDYTTVDNKPPEFIFDSVMINMGFRHNFSIDQEKLDRMMKSEKYKDLVYETRYEPTGQTSVNIKIVQKVPDNFEYTKLVCHPKTTVQTKTNGNPYKKYKKMNNKSYTTLIVFSSSETILSGKYIQNMKEIYNFFTTEVHKNRAFIEEKIKDPIDFETFTEKENVVN